MADENTDDRQRAPQGGRHGERRQVADHVPVLLETAIEFLAVKRGGTYIDATVGLGGHSLALAGALGASGHLIGFDKDPAALDIARQQLAKPPDERRQDWPSVALLHASFAEIGERVAAGEADGILADLGVSSLQLEDAARGFSFQADGPLDMRMDPQAEPAAEQVVNHMDEPTLAQVIYEFGEERRSRRIARAIVRARPIRSTAHLAQVVTAAARPMKFARIHPATRTFQAIRIYVNRELEDLRALLAAAPQVLQAGGRLVIVSFHSLEDRLVKESLRQGAHQGQWRILTNKPLRAGPQEIAQNPRARSAKLRAAVRL